MVLNSALLLAEQNYIAPGKKPLSSMSPLILLKAGRVAGVVGASGGSKIISAIVNTVVRAFIDKQDPFEAVNAARVHHQLIPYNVFSEHKKLGPKQWALSTEVKEYLKAKVGLRSLFCAQVLDVVM